MERSRKHPRIAITGRYDRLRCLVEDSLVGSFIIQEGRFVYVNPRLAEILGYTRAELIEFDYVEDMIHPDDRERFSTDISVLTGNVSRKIISKIRILRKDGSTVHSEILSWGSFIDEIPSITGSIMDISERMLAEESLKESEKALRTIIDSVYDAVFIHDDNGVLLGVNGKMLDMFKVTRGEAMRYNFDEEYSSPDNHFSRIREAWRSVMDGEERHLEWKARRPGDSSEFYVDIYLRRIRLWERDVILANVRDITERKQAEKDRSALYHMMTHDIKGPLSIIYGYGDLINSMVKDPEVLDMVREVMKAANRITGQVTDMLDISRLEYGESGLELEPVDLEALLREAVGDHVLSSDECGVDISLDFCDGVGVVKADPKQLVRAISNLVSNAVVYCGHGCKVTVSCGRSDAHPDYVYIEVRDTGSGIPEEDIPFIFDKYYRSQKTYKKRGTGLGLAIVKAVAESHGGMVELESREGVGSTFRILLPV